MSEDDFRIGVDFSEPETNSFTVLTQWMDRQLINALALPPNLLQDSDSFHYRESRRRELHDWMSLVMDIQLVVTASQDDAIVIARELRDRYPNMSFAEIGQAVRAGALRRTPLGKCSISPRWLERQNQPTFAHEVSGVADLLNQMTAPREIGNTNCKYNAQSSFLRCAVNPSGPCEGCDYFESEERDRV